MAGQQPNFDIAVLRTLIAVDELGSFARAAAKVGRSESAVSLQLKRLEEQVGFPLFQRIGRNMTLTNAGDALIRNARRLVELNDEAFSALPGASVSGTVRLGVTPDVAETWMSVAMIRVARAYPAIRVQTVINRTPMLLRQLDNSEIDIALTFATEQATHALWSAVVPMCWIGPRRFTLPNPSQPLSQLSALDAAAGLPKLPTVAMVINQRRDGEITPAMSGVSDMLIETLESTLDAAF
jgi:DNA-binding transcriptional LysR family regulator